MTCALNELLPLSPTEERYRQQYLKAADNREPEELIKDPEWLDANASTVRGKVKPVFKVPEEDRHRDIYIYLQRHERYYVLGLHPHDWIEMLCVVRGRCTHRVGSITGTLNTGDVLLISPGTQHTFLAVDDDCIVYNLYLPVLHFEDEFYGILHSQSQLSAFLLKTMYADSRDAFLIFHAGNYFQRKNHLSDLWDEWQNEHPYARNRLTSLLQLLFFDLLTYQEKPITVSMDVPAAQGRSQTLLNYVQRRCETTTVQELSTVFNYSPRQISRIFRQTTGMSCQDYILKCREERFLSLLLGTNMNIQKIMQMAGIRTENQFYNDFRAKYGMSPSEYRMQYQKP